MEIKQLYNDSLRKLQNEYGDVSVIYFFIFITFTSTRTDINKTQKYLLWMEIINYLLVHYLFLIIDFNTCFG